LFDKCLYLLRDRQEAEDAVQETFMRAYMAMSRFHLGGYNLPWLYRIATNVCFSVIRIRNRKGAVPAGKLDREEAAPGAGADLRAHYRQVLARVIDSLDDRGKMILVAHFIEGLNQGEIAEVLGVSRRAVVKRLTVLRRQLELLSENEHG
jgi:RNA polymerase sigma-70 factor, ECF subfamily